MIHSHICKKEMSVRYHTKVKIIPIIQHLRTDFLPANLFNFKNNLTIKFLFSFNFFLKIILKYSQTF